MTAFIGRREFITLLGGAAAAWPLAARAQPRKGPRVGNFRGTPSETTAAFMEGLREVGYVDGQNVLIEIRDYGTISDRAHELAKELVALQCDAIFAPTPYAIQAAMRATTTIPIVGLDLESDRSRAGGPRASAILMEILPDCSSIYPSWAANRLSFSEKPCQGFCKLEFFQILPWRGPVSCHGNGCTRIRIVSAITPNWKCRGHP